ncbi:MAG: GntR family transcriptional regulator [Parasporobacterium sp.]|nr:GntR family transcriptional regulator [Parasporobacterium sp.]
MYIEIDFNSDEAIYMQLRNQIIAAIATSQLKEGESLPSVRNLADNIGVNMHTVNKAYSSLRQDGFLKVDRRRGAVVAVDIDKLHFLNKMKVLLQPVVISGIVKGISREEAKGLIDDIYDELGF